MTIIKRFSDILRANAHELKKALMDDDSKTDSFDDFEFYKDRFDKEYENRKFKDNQSNYEEKKNSLEEEYYANLELSYGSSFSEVKKSYRKLLKIYHPDNFEGDDRQNFAKEITQKLNDAYGYFEVKNKKEGR